MKFSLESIRISIAGAKLSHLVQKDRIWDHGSMTEQARIVFHLMEKAKSNGNIEPVRKYMTIPCFEKLQKQFDTSRRSGYEWQTDPFVITEVAVISVRVGKTDKPDMFKALIKGHNGKKSDDGDYVNKFSVYWSFVRQGEWWILNQI